MLLLKTITYVPKVIIKSHTRKLENFQLYFSVAVEDGKVKQIFD